MKLDLSHLSTSTPASEVEAPHGDDLGDNTQMPTMADILKNSPAAALIGIAQDEEESQPEDSEQEGISEDDPEPNEDEESEEETSEEGEEEESETEDDEESTQEEEDESDLPSEEDIDWEYKIPVKINGKVSYVTLEEVRKGYATDQHLSQKGRELGEERKRLEEERNTKLNELVQLGTILHNEFM